MMKKVISLVLMVGMIAAVPFLMPWNAMGEGQNPKPVQTGEVKTITAYIKEVNHSEGGTSLIVDPISWYQGEAANKAFKELEPEAYAEIGGVPDDYYIVNNTEENIPYPVDNQAEVLMQLYDHTGLPEDVQINWNESISLNKFEALYTHKELLDLAGFPYHLTIKDGRVLKIVQQYVP